MKNLILFLITSSMGISNNEIVLFEEKLLSSFRAADLDIDLGRRN